MTTPSNTDTVVEGDKIYIQSSQTADVKLAPLSLFKSYLESYYLAKSFGDFFEQYLSPTAGQFLYIESIPDNIHVILTPADTLSSCGLFLPSRDFIDEQEILITTSEAISAFLLIVASPFGDTISGAPSTLSAGGFFLMKYNKLSNTWIRTG